MTGGWHFGARRRAAQRLIDLAHREGTDDMPPDLLQRLREDISLPAAADRREPVPRQAVVGRRRWLVAASIAGALFATLLALRVRERLAPPAERPAIADRSAQLSATGPASVRAAAPAGLDRQVAAAGKAEAWAPSPPIVAPTAAADQPASPRGGTVAAGAAARRRVGAPEEAPSGADDVSAPLEKKLRAAEGGRAPAQREFLPAPGAPPPAPASAEAGRAEKVTSRAAAAGAPAAAPYPDSASPTGTVRLPESAGFAAAPPPPAASLDARRQAAPQERAVAPGARANFAGGVAALAQSAASPPLAGATLRGTFGARGSTASYRAVRHALLDEDRLPGFSFPAEEVVNAFGAVPPAPAGALPQAVAEGVSLPGTPSTFLLRLAVWSEALPGAENLAVTFDAEQVAWFRRIEAVSRPGGAEALFEVGLSSSAGAAGDATLATLRFARESNPAPPPLLTVRLASLRRPWQAASPALRRPALAMQLVELLQAAAAPARWRELRANTERLARESPGDALAAELLQLVERGETLATAAKSVPPPPP